MDWLPVEKLVVDEEYQRDTSSRRSQMNIEKIVENFSWHKFSPITVSEAGIGSYSIVDGQHRVEAVKQLGDVDKVPCWIISGAKKAEQAFAFVGINRDRVATTPYAIHKSLAVAGDKDACMVDDFCYRIGIKINKNTFTIGKDPTVTNALGTIRAFLKRKHEEQLSFAVNVIRGAYPFKSGQIKSDIIKCLAALYVKYKDKIKKDVLIEALRSFDDVEIICSKASQLSKLDASVSRQNCMQKIVLNEYNARLNGAKKAATEVKPAKVVNYGCSK